MRSSHQASSIFVFSVQLSTEGGRTDRRPHTDCQQRKLLVADPAWHRPSTRAGFVPLHNGLQLGPSEGNWHQLIFREPRLQGHSGSPRSQRRQKLPAPGAGHAPSEGLGRTLPWLPGSSVAGIPPLMLLCSAFILPFPLCVCLLSVNPLSGHLSGFRNYPDNSGWAPHLKTLTWLHLQRLPISKEGHICSLWGLTIQCTARTLCTNLTDEVGPRTLEHGMDQLLSFPLSWGSRAPWTPSSQEASPHKQASPRCSQLTHVCRYKEMTVT